MALGNSPDLRPADTGARFAARPSDLAAVALALILAGAAVGHQVLLGPAPTRAAMRAAGGALSGPLDPPRAFLCHGSWVHLVANGVTIALAAWLWLGIARLTPTRRVAEPGAVRSKDRSAPAAGLVGLSALSGALALGLAAALDGGARVGASGAAHALLGGLAIGLLEARGILLALAPFGLALLLAALPTGPTVDHLAHGLGFGVGALLQPVATRAPRALLGLAAAWYLAAALS